MRIKKDIPLHKTELIEEIDLDTAKGFEGFVGENFSAEFKFIPELSLKDISIPILSPLVAEDVPGSPAEPVYDAAARDDIQGNIIPGFNKDHQHFLFFRIEKVKTAKAFLRDLVPRISTMEEVIAYRRLYRARRFKLGRHNTMLCSTWLNIGFSHHGIALLANPADADAFGDASFKLGLKERSSYLGDPTTRTHSGYPTKWKVGGPKNEADIVLILASDHPEVLDDLVALLKLQAAASGLDLIFEQRGAPCQAICEGTSISDSKTAFPSPV